MRKTTLRLLAVAACGLSAMAASAQQQANWQFGAAIGNSTFEKFCEGSSNCDETGRALRLSFGRAMGNGLVLEGMLLNYGEAKATEFGVSVNMEGQAVGVGLAYQMPVSGPVEFLVRGGLAQVKLRAKAAGFGVRIEESETKTGAYYGLGLAYRVSPSTAVELSWNRSSAKFEGESIKLSALLLGVNHSF